MFGRGPIATIYGWALERAGHDVEFYVRPGRAAEYGEIVDLDLLDGRGSMRAKRITERWHVRYRETLEPDHDFELIVLSVAHSRLSEAARFISPRVGGATVLIFGNVWAEPADAVGDLPPDQVAWGFPQAGGTFDDNGLLSGALLSSVVLGTLGEPLRERDRAVRRTFLEAGLRPKEQPDMRGWLWIHFIADAGMHAQGLRVGSLSKLAGASGDLREALLTSRELLPLLEARGVELRRHRRSTLLFRAPAAITAGAMAWATKHIAIAGRSLQAHSDPGAAEPREVCRDTLAEARLLGVPAPRLEAEEGRFTAAVS
jgi:2-dehydropantoate 2-reductase